MNYLKKYGIRLAYTLASIFLSILLLTTLYQFDLISEKVFSIVKIIILLICLFINSFLLGKTAENKGYLEGVKFSIIIITLFILLTFIFNLAFSSRMILYYLIIFLTIILGSILGINKKRS